MTEQQSPHQKQTVFHIHIANLDQLKAMYLSYVRNGGLFIPVKEPLTLGDKVFLVIRLFDEINKIPICATVVWVSPGKALENKVQGLGLQFIDTGNGAAGKIEKALPDGKLSGLQSFTM